MLHIACIRAGEAFSPAYVTILHDMVRRNLAEGFEGRFVCFTDRPHDLPSHIETEPLPAALPKWWSKLALFKPGLFPDGDRVLFLDLDTVITGRLDEIATYDGPFAILRDFYRPDGLQSAVMAWTAGEASEIWTSFDAAGRPMDDPGGDQAWIERTHLQSAVRLQDVFPDLFVSYKLTKGIPTKASVVVFHGQPRPHEVAGWVPEVWRVGGMSRADLDTICNTENRKLKANVRSAITRRLDWLDTAEPHDGHAVLVGGGPSIKDKLEEIRWRRSLNQSIWAMNGSAKFLADNGIRPDFYVIADARKESRWLIQGTNRDTTHFVASQCDPSVFQALDKQDVVLWHVNSPGMADILKDEKDRPVHLIGGGSTVGLNAMVIAFARGFRKIHLYGFDSSYRDDDHHAYRQDLNAADRVIDALFAGRKWKTTAWMAQQVGEFQDLVPGLLNDGCIITAHGDGLLQAAAAEMMYAPKVTAAEIRANEVMKRVGGPNPKGVEVGVFAGDMSSALLSGHPTLCLDMVDSWEGNGAAYEGDSGDWHADLTQHAQDAFLARAKASTSFAEQRRRIIRARSTDAAAQAENATYDFVFLDADHSYQGCKADIEAWVSKVKPGGWLCGHDYENDGFPRFGVTQAVNEFAAERGVPLEIGENYCWFVQIPIIISNRECLLCRTTTTF